jgi:glutamate-1-semialdehyde aminotransferase
VTYPDPSSRSARLHARASRVMAGGSTRLTVFTSPYPLCLESGSGSRIRDVDATPPERRRLAALYQHLINRGYVSGPTGLVALSTALDERDVDGFGDALHDSLIAIRNAEEKAA